MSSAFRTVRVFAPMMTAWSLVLPAVASAQSSGFDKNRLARIDTLMQMSVDSNRIAGATALVLRDGKTVYEHTVGWSDKESGRKMTTDAIFRIASQSKAITSTAALMLVEEGKLALSDPVSRYIPQFARTTVALRSDTGRTPVPARRQITIKDLMTHTSGYSYGVDGMVAARYSTKGLGPAAGFGWYTADKDEPICTSMETLASLPAVAQPGEQWVYGYSLDILGCVIERASGMPLDRFIKTRITDPLGMKDTYFFLPVDRKSRLVTVYMSDSTNHAVRAPEGSRGQGHYVDGPRKSFSGGAGLLSTSHDYARFLQMLLQGGQMDGKRYLSPRMVDVMTSNQVGTLYGTAGQGWGLAFATVERLGADGMASVGSYSWGGAYASTYRVDPAERLVFVFMINQIPSRTDLPAKFSTLLYQALTDVRSHAVQR